MFGQLRLRSRGLSPCQDGWAPVCTEDFLHHYLQVQVLNDPDVVNQRKSHASLDTSQNAKHEYWNPRCTFNRQSLNETSRVSSKRLNLGQEHKHSDFDLVQWRILIHHHQSKGRIGNIFHGSLLNPKTQHVEGYAFKSNYLECAPIFKSNFLSPSIANSRLPHEAAKKPL